MQDRCRLCGTRLTGPDVATLEGAPAGAQVLPSSDGLASDSGITLAIRECPGCGLVQSASEPVAYHRDAITAAGLSREMLEHRSAQVADWVDRHGLAGASVVEAGCGRGDMLPLLAEAGLRPVGLEHSVPAEGATTSDGIRIEHGYPADGSAIPGGPFDAFVCFDFLEHAPDPRDFLRGIATNLAPDGVGLVEVPSLEHDIEQRCGYDWIADHVSYFTAGTLRRALELGGFNVIDVRRTWKGYDLEADVRRRQPSGAAALANDLQAAADALDSWLAAETGAGRRPAVWGASHQSLTLLSQAERGSDVRFIVDSAPFKQGRYSPATHIPIVAPSEMDALGCDSILVMAAGYSDEVVSTLRSDLRFAGGVYVLRDNDVVPA